MNTKEWLEKAIQAEKKKAIPVLSFPSAPLLGITVKELISDSKMQAKGMKIIADRCDTWAAVSMMDLSVEAEAFGSDIVTDDNEVPTVTGSIIKTAADADNLKIPSVGAGRTGIYIETAKQARELITDRPVFSGTIGPFSLSGRLMDMTEIMTNCYIEPEMVHTTQKKSTQFLIDYINEYKKTGVSGVFIAEPAAGLLSPALIEEFSNPYIQEIIDNVQTDNFSVIYHNCGNVIPLMGSIKNITAHGYHFGNAIDISEALSLAAPDRVVMGNISPANEFRAGTPESVYQATYSLLEKCSKHKNFIISSGCDIPPLSPWNNIDAFFKAVSDFYN